MACRLIYSAIQADNDDTALVHYETDLSGISTSNQYFLNGIPLIKQDGPSRFAAVINAGGGYSYRCYLYYSGNLRIWEFNDTTDGLRDPLPTGSARRGPSALFLWELSGAVSNNDWDTVTRFWYRTNYRVNGVDIGSDLSFWTWRNYGAGNVSNLQSILTTKYQVSNASLKTIKETGFYPTSCYFTKSLQHSGANVYKIDSLPLTLNGLYSDRHFNFNPSIFSTFSSPSALPRALSWHQGTLYIGISSFERTSPVVLIEMAGGGGGGGTPGTGQNGGGGGAGAYALFFLDLSQSGAGEFVVGAGGAINNDGGSTSLSFPSQSLSLVLNGGKKGGTTTGGQHGVAGDLSLMIANRSRWFALEYLTGEQTYTTHGGNGASYSANYTVNAITRNISTELNFSQSFSASAQRNGYSVTATSTSYARISGAGGLNLISRSNGTHGMPYRGRYVVHGGGADAYLDVEATAPAIGGGGPGGINIHAAGNPNHKVRPPLAGANGAFRIWISTLGDAGFGIDYSK